MKVFIKFLVKFIPRKYLIRFSNLFSFFIQPFYYGNKYHCPVCNGSFRKLLPYGNKGTENRLCPKCLSLERHRLLWLFMKKNLNIFDKNIKVLHIAPEQPFIKRFKKQTKWIYITADLESPLANVKMDIKKMPFNNEEFDFVICNHVLEHIDDDITAMKEIYRVMKKESMAILQVPIDYKRTNTYENSKITTPEEREKHFGQYDHVRVYGLDYTDRLKSVGFKVEVNSFVKTIDPQDIDKYRLDLNELIYIAYKQ